VSAHHLDLLAYAFRWSVVQDSFGQLGQGVKITLQLSLVSLVLSLALGLVVALCRMAPLAPVRIAAYVYIQIFRAVSLYIYVLWVYFGLAGATGINFSPLTAGVIALTILNSAYMAEIYRAALGAVDRGQFEAATSLGFGRIRGFSTVILPQAIRIAVPSLVNQFVDIVKDSSIVAIIGTMDLMGVTNQLVGFYRAPFELYTLVAFYYLTLVLMISALAAGLERRLQRHLQ
jgi:His/Glu/Gln/Arg/opine family amino acid ABC transporter permease subunit